MLFDSQLTAAASRASVQVSLDGMEWATLHEVPASEDWTPIDVDLAAFAGELIYLRFVLDASTSVHPASPDVWRIDNVRVERSLEHIPGAELEASRRAGRQNLPERR